MAAARYTEVEAGEGARIEAAAEGAEAEGAEEEGADRAEPSNQ